MSIFNRQLRYAISISESIFRILTNEQRRKYNLIFGKNVIGTYDTEADARFAQNNEFEYFHTVLVTPIESIERIDEKKC